MQLAVEDLLEGERLVYRGVLGLKAGLGIWRVGEEGFLGACLRVDGRVRKLEMEMHVGLVMGLVEVAVDDVTQEGLLDLWRNDVWENQETLFLFFLVSEKIREQKKRDLG